MQDPLEKEGVVGLFNRVFFPINLAIDTFLRDVYEPTDKEDRYHLIESSSMAGVEIKEGGKFAYSHHAKDPVYLKLCNAFDLVRIHKFGDVDEKESFRQMCDFALSVDSVKLEALEERHRQAGDEFAEEDDWRKGLELDRKGNIKDTLDNIVLIIRNDEGLKSIAFNCHRDGIDAREGLPWEQIKGGWSDSDAASLKVYLSKNYGIYSPTKTKDAVVAVAQNGPTIPSGSIWRVFRNGTVFPAWIHCWWIILELRITAIQERSAGNHWWRLSQESTSRGRSLTASDLKRPTGDRKIYFLCETAGEWFSDSLTLTDMKDKSGPEKLQGYWILELGELAGMRKADIEPLNPLSAGWMINTVLLMVSTWKAIQGSALLSGPRMRRRASCGTSRAIAASGRCACLAIPKRNLGSLPMKM